KSYILATLAAPVRGMTPRAEDAGERDRNSPGHAMHAVIVDGDVSYPPTSGKRLRTLHLMLRLAERHQVTYIARCEALGEETRQATEFLSDHHIEPILVDQPLPAKKGLRFYGRLAANLASAWPYSVTSHQGARMRAAVRDYAARRDVDL